MIGTNFAKRFKPYFTREYLLDYFNIENFKYGMQTCRWRYKAPVLISLFISLTLLVTITSTIGSIISGVFIIASIFSLAMVEV